jgi:beta-galactosidase/beta-glucuronidase
MAATMTACKPEIVDAVELGVCATTAPPSTCPSWQQPIPIPTTSQDAGATPGDWAPKRDHIVTRWSVDPRAAHPEYPRPQLVRPEWAPLNGLWDYAIVPVDAPDPTIWDGKILVPFPVQSALSGVERFPKETDRVVYHRTFDVPPEWQGRKLMLRFGAVDYDTTVSLNHQPVGTHRGGYDAFAFDVSGLLSASGPQDLVVSVVDPTTAGVQPRGKQSFTPGGIYYTAVTGIWQTVWLEPIPDTHIDGLVMVSDADGGRLQINANLGVAAADLTADVLVFENTQSDKVVAKANGPADQAISVAIPNPVLWSTESESPQLYGLRINLRRGDEVLDSVGSYAGLRKIGVGPLAGATRILQNGQFVFQVGVLDQGYWPDGLYTAPTDEALEADVSAMKQLGFNAVRKHVKVEPDRWYWHCDRYGLNVWQDMPNGGVPITDADKQQFATELLAMVDGRRNHPSIMTWILYNADWGLYDSTGELALRVKERDPSRLVDYTSGMASPVSSVNDTHSYPVPAATLPPDGTRPAIISEFGGTGWRYSDDHSWDLAMYDNNKEAVATREQLAARFAELMKALYQLRDTKGISGGMYTQLTDIETEDNGLYTYDRAVKLAIGDVKAAVTGQ